MARPPDPEKRAALLERCFAAAQEGGTLDLSLATLAERVGTSARMLVYHFGSREGLQRALAARTEAELRARFVEFEAAAPSEGVEAATLALWDYLSSPQMRGLVRLTMDVVNRAGQGDEVAARLGEQESRAWAGFLASRVSDPDVAEGLLLLVLGAAVDLLVSGDPARGRRAIHAFFAR